MHRKHNSGFILAPILILTLISLLIIATGSNELHQTVLMHKLQLYKNCINLIEQFEPQLEKSGCPACPLPLGCY